MHIPDGYLESTCAVLYAGATPFWVVALKRARRALSEVPREEFHLSARPSCLTGRLRQKAD